MRVPAFVPVVAVLWRLVSGPVKTVIRHPVACLLAGSLAGLFVQVTVVDGLLTGLLAVLLAVGVMGSLLGCWRAWSPESFTRWVGLPSLAWWRWMRVYRRHWVPVMTIAGLGVQFRARDYLPSIRRVTCTAHLDRVTVHMLKGQAPDAFADRAAHLAHGFGSTSCRVRSARPGWVVLEFARTDLLADPVAALPVSAIVDLEAVPVGRQDDGAPWLLRLLGTHVLITGVTGAGKGSIIWSTVRALLPAIAAGTVQVWGVDPKRMELSFGRSLLHQYGATPAECVEVLEAAVAEMHARADSYAGVTRRHTATAEDPFILVVVDEVAFLTAYQTDRDLKRRAEHAIATLTSQGRSVGVCVMAALQDPRKEVMNVRNLFPDKIAMRLDEPEQVAMVLGGGARDRGALCDLISSDPRTGAGVAFVVLETSPDPVRVRAAWVSDSDIREMATTLARWAPEAAPLGRVSTRPMPSMGGGA